MTGVLAGVGVMVAAVAAAYAILAPPSRSRALAMLVALVLFPVLIAGDQWHSAQISDLRHSPARIAALAAVAIAAVALAAVVFTHRPRLMPLALVAALPFRIPLESGGTQANLLVPLYLVIAGGVIAACATELTGGGEGEARWLRSAPPRWLARSLAAFVVVYAAGALYSEDFSKGIQDVCFFVIPFSVAFALLVGQRWDRRLLLGALGVLGLEATVFVLIGFAEFASRDLLWNGGVIRSNDFHVYFRVNSLFWDPNVYGRYLALVIVAAAGALLWSRERRLSLLLAGLVALLWAGLVLTYSQSSFAALLAGLAVLAALRWSLRWTALACALAAAASIGFVLAAGGSLKVDLSSSNTVNKDTSGRGSLVSGGAELFTDRPVLGFGTGSFSAAFRKRIATRRRQVSESHTEPITVAAEGGIVGLAVYAALLVTALWTMTAGLRRTMPGLVRGPPPAGAETIARATVLAMFAALLVHTMAYAGFFSDPMTWVLLAVACALSPLPDGAEVRSGGVEGAEPSQPPVRSAA
ncbi:MAG: O-antigen ligase family protein [Solirubrobacterales bacterium]